MGWLVRVVEGRAMLDSLRQQAWRRINVTFPQRQIYIRSDGRVQFFTFDPMMQVILAGAGLLFLGWVAFTSVNVIFKDRIIAAKERHFVEMQSAYENRIADLQVSYDELNGALAETEDQYKTIADTFEAKQRALASLIGHKQNLQASLGVGKLGPVAQENSAPLTTTPPSSPPPPIRAATANSTAPAATAYYGIGGVISQSMPGFTASLSLPPTSGIGALRSTPPFSSVPSMMPREAGLGIMMPQPTFLRGAVERLGALFGRKVSANQIDNRSLRHIAEEQARVGRLDDANPMLLSETKLDFDREVARLTRIFKATGIDPASFAARSGRRQGEGGPLLPIAPVQIATSDQVFNAGLAGAVGSLASLNEIVISLQALPLAQPLTNGELTSGFGARSDPFTENLAYHTGQDYSATQGASVYATAPGVVVYAARLGDYGNAVEVDHGNRIHTRYAHLSKIGVPVGQRIQKGDIVGLVGSTGRSTGPHVHYEVWYDSVVKDPGKFIRAGHDVLKN
jgi:murein DD-endopeptidase MepM/ murein hydrolase activator NlpD